MTEPSPADARQPPPPRRLGMVFAPVVVFAALVGMFAFALQKGDPSRLPSALIGKSAPRLPLPPVEELSDAGRPVPGIDAAALASGKPIVVNFFASWCGPCVEEHPLLVGLQRQGVTVLGVNYKDVAVNARRFLARYGNPYARVGADRDGRVAIEWGVYGMPETFVLDGRGTIVMKHVGPLTQEIVDGRLLPALRRAASAP